MSGSPFPPFRRVVILRDPAAPLYYMRCATPCGARGRDGEWCMRGPEAKHPPHCYLGGAPTAERAAAWARSLGYEVVEP